MRTSHVPAILVCLALGPCENCDVYLPDREILVYGNVQLNGAPAVGLEVFIENSGVQASAVTDGRGNYQVTWAYYAGHTTVNNPEVRVAEPANSSFLDNPRLVPTSGKVQEDFVGYDQVSISGTATWNGVPVSDVVVHLMSRTTAFGLDASTDAAGTYTIGPLRPDRYSVSAQSNLPGSWTPGSAILDVLDQPIVQDFTIEFRSGPLQGRVTAAGSGLAGVVVTTVGPWPATTTTDAAGAYSFPTVIPGDYAVSISGFDATVYAFPATEQLITLPDAMGGVVDFDATIIGQNAPPLVAISSPAAGSRFGTGTVIQFAGSATDVEDGMLTGSSLEWSSSRDGTFGSGGAVTATLSEGMHTVTLTATDSDGAVGTATVDVEVVANQPPTVSMVTPVASQILTQGSTFTFQGSGSDPEDGVLSGASLVWTSDVEGQIGTGASLSRALNATGFHYITLTGTDSLGATASVTVRIYVQPN